MKITAIKQQINDENRVSVFVDGKYSFSLTLDQVLAEKIKKDIEIDENRLSELEELSLVGKQRARARDWLLNRLHSTKEFREYCFRKKIDPELRDAWVEDFTEKGYLDDAKFANWFAENRRRKNKSNREITSELMSKGVNREVINSVLMDLNSEDSTNSSEEDSLQALVAKLRTRTRYKDDKKLTAYLISKGFRYDQIKKSLEPET